MFFRITQISLLILFLFASVSFDRERKVNHDEGFEREKLKNLNALPDSCNNSFTSEIASIYRALGDTSLNFDAFQKGVTGYYKLVDLDTTIQRDTLVIIDYSKPSNSDRFFIIDLCTQEIVHKSIVAHGKNSGGLYAHSFSNTSNSHKSSIGFFRTSETYQGKFGLGLRLDGLEYCNNRVRDRGVVIHAAKYATYEFLHANNGQLGRSFGCPALPYEKFPEVINWIKNGTCLFVYYPDEAYLNRSEFIEVN
jgi:hypothetical protein